MDNKMVIGVVALIIVIGGGWYLLAKAPVANQPAQPAAADQAVQAQTGTGTIGDLLAMGPSQCTVAVDQGGAPAQGMVMVANGKLAGSFSAAVNGQTVNAYMINDGTNIYTWTDQSAQGFKMPVATGSATSTAGTGNQPLSATTPTQYSCTPWVEDDSVFAPPASVTFMDTAQVKAPTGAPKKP